MAIIKQQIKDSVANNLNLMNYYNSFGVNIDTISSLEEIPPIPVNLFKEYDLTTCPKEKVVRVLNSSSTTTGIPSVIPLDATTANRQKKGLISILKSIIGSKRLPYIVFDVRNINDPKKTKLTARGAAVRGIENFSKKTYYVMQESDEGSLNVDFDLLDQIQKKHSTEPILAFGFTFMIWSALVDQLRQSNKTYNFPNMIVFHSGGWKKLTSQKVTKEKFNHDLAELLGCNSSNIIDFYGMVEQVGIIYPDCEAGNKHVPNFGDIIIRDIFTMNEVPIGQEGLIETISALPTSYPGQALLTEDIGEFKGVDDCPCGKKGKYFVFKSRVEKAEIRGCGDTFAQRLVKLRGNQL